MYHMLRPWIFKLDPEVAHQLSTTLMQLAGDGAVSRALVRAIFGPTVDRPVDCLGLRFRNPIGLAAGYDKEATAWRGLAALGFGHVEVGTVTPRPQTGHPRPRVFRVPEQQSLINRLGFPGPGVEKVVARLGSDRPYDVVLGANIGKNKDTLPEDTVADYQLLIEQLAPCCDYLAINISSPNTPGLRHLQGRDALSTLLNGVLPTRDAAAHRLGKRVPLLVKISPDLDDHALDTVLDVLLQYGVDGIVATNTTVRHGAPETGGLSGVALREQSTVMIKKIHTRSAGALPIIGVGGVMTADDVRAKLDAGATLVQLYTALVYEGPALVKKIVQSL